jgi:hypothetical protein
MASSRAEIELLAKQMAAKAGGRSFKTGKLYHSGSGAEASS